MRKKIIVVGGGPAGMMAAISAASHSQDVTLIEKNPILGKKLLLSGKGRCNLTNACEIDPFLKRFFENGQFLRDAFRQFFNTELMDFFQSRGLKLVTERQMRVFPLEGRSDAVLEVLKKELQARAVQVMLRASLKDIAADTAGINGIWLENGRHLPAEKVILATGGVSYAFTGSTGEGLRIAEKFGHTIVPLRPGLVPLCTKQQFCRFLEGLSLRNIRLTFGAGKHKAVSDIGELLFTSFGVSGPLVITHSGRIADWSIEHKDTWLEIDMKPALSFEQLDARFLREFKEFPRRSIKNMLKSMLPQKFIPVFLDAACVLADTRVSHIKHQERRKMVTLLKAFHLDIASTRPIEEAMVTRGGVSLKEINPRTMESRLCKNLYFAGEIMDIDADTGGFNLQAAFSTGFLAGKSAALN
ncbi:MAG: NAD(P)/FAD-dependent oxidoreductase [Candidatus Omnitrophica bacterium]|nr:NAD(P)/FAD-dependent oxidoreductase [Candidatus Omnitrophota bacterium]